MRVLDSILVGVDLEPDLSAATPGSLEALAQARWSGERNGARVTLLHSTKADERWDDGESGYVPVFPHPGSPADTALQRYVDELRAAGIEADAVTSNDRPELALIQHALRHSPDLVIVSKRSYERKQRTRMGGVALRLIRMCPAPVWVVGPGGGKQPESVLACTDMTATGDLALRMGAEVAERCDAAFHVTHAFQYHMDIQLSDDDAKREWEESYRKETRQKIQTLLEAVGMAERAEIHIGLTSPTRAIQESIDRLEPDLLVMGSISRSGLSGLVIGNTAERVFAAMDCSLLIVKPEDFQCPVQL